MINLQHLQHSRATRDLLRKPTLNSSDCAERHLGSLAMASCQERPNDPHRSGGSIAATSAHQLPFFIVARSLLLCLGTGVGGTVLGDGGGDTMAATAGAVAARGRMPPVRRPFGSPVPCIVSLGLFCTDASLEGQLVIKPAGTLDYLHDMPGRSGAAE